VSIGAHKDFPFSFILFREDIFIPVTYELMPNDKKTIGFLFFYFVIYGSNSMLRKIIIQVSVSINIIATGSISTKRVPWLPKFSNNFCICTCLHAQAQLRDRERC
jgi:hypothetical protein